MINTQFPVVRTSSVAALATAMALSLSPAATAQDSEKGEKKKVSARVLVLGADGAILQEDIEGTEGVDLFLKTREAAQEEGHHALVDALTLHIKRLRGPYLGIELVNLNEPLRAHFGVPEGSGVLVSSVIEDSPAARAGVQVGDILTRFGGQDVASSQRLGSMVRDGEAGDPADIEIWRDGKVEMLSTTLDERPRPAIQPVSRTSFFLRGREDLDGDGEVDVLVGPENLKDLPEKIQEYFNGNEWKERHEGMQRFLHERQPEVKAMEERFEAVKKRLAELESRLEEMRRTDNDEN